MSEFDAEHIYSLYNTDNGVVLYDSLEEARNAKSRWLEVVPVDGPFEHLRPERKLIFAAQRALGALIGVCDTDSALAEVLQLESVVTELQHALDEVINPNLVS